MNSRDVFNHIHQGCFAGVKEGTPATNKKIELLDPLFFHMMTSSNGNIFRITDPLCGEFNGSGEFPAQRPVTRSFDVFVGLRLNKRLSKQLWGWWFETPSWSLWRQCNEHTMSCKCMHGTTTREDIRNRHCMTCPHGELNGWLCSILSLLCCMYCSVISTRVLTGLIE